jgi:hypothetical protein
MGFSNKLGDGFARVIETSPYTVLDQITKLQFVSKGNNVIFGRTLKESQHSELLYLGKVTENSQGKNYLGADAWLDTTFPHVIYITGTRGSGKSFDLGVLLEGISELSEPSSIQNEVAPITSILVDTQSQFWTLRYGPRSNIPANATQIEELNRWGLKPNFLKRTKIYVPPGAQKFLGDEIDLRIRPSDVSHEEWCSILDQDVYGPQGHILAQTIEHFGGRPFEIADMLSYIAAPANWPGIAESSRNAIAYKLEDYDRTGLFDSKGMSVRDFLKKGVCNILMLRDLRNEDKALVTAVIARQLFTIMGEHHNKKKVADFFGKTSAGDSLPGKVWLFIDEAHVVAPKEGPSPARAALIEYVKRGRDAGLSLILATQQPAAVDDRILSQVNLSLNHRLTFQSDISAAINRIPTKTISSMKVSGAVLNDFGDMIRFLDAGQCFLGDHSTSRAMMIQIRPRVSAHGGYSPI